MGCDKTRMDLGLSAQISIHAPAWGATYRTGGMMKVSLISIHAPAWGATKINVDRIFILIFQSTHPRGVRRLRLLLHLALCNISIHAPAWGATECGQRIVYPEKYFNPRTRVGCDHWFPRKSHRYIDFNPRTRVGCDSKSL